VRANQRLLGAFLHEVTGARRCSSAIRWAD
jgi:hypothetical protein